MPEPLHGHLAARALRRVGASLCGRYRLERLIGMGGMAAVYAGRHRNGHVVAIKILHDRLSSDAEVERLFRREALLANQIKHAGVVPVIDDDVTDDGCAFLVMPLLTGETLRATSTRLGKALAPPDAVASAVKVLDVLAVAHAAKIVHRDIKPENVFLTNEGDIRILDFGIARFFETNDPASATRSGRAVGTPAFMAPEQALGRLREIDGRTDIWATGALLFSLIAGRTVHEGESGSEVIVRAATCAAPALGEAAPGTPEAICTIVDRALSFEKGARWPDADSMKRELMIAFEASFGRPLAEHPRLLPIALEPADVHGVTTHRPALEAAGETAGGVASAIRRDSTGFRGRATRTMTVALSSLASSKKWLVGGAALAAISVSIVGARALSHRTTASSPGTTPPAELSLHLTASRSAWRDGSSARARSEAREAVALASASAQAHLAVLRVSSFWPDDDARHEFLAAQQARDELAPVEREYLEALAPAMSVPANFALAAERLRQLHERTPTELEVTIALSDMLSRVGRVTDAITLLEPLASSPEPAGVVLADLGVLYGENDNVESARDTLRRCLASFPAANRCAGMLSQLELFEGHCEDAERVTRQELQSDPKSPATHYRLALALDALGANVSELRPVLEKWAALSDAPGSHATSTQVEILLALREGRLREVVDLNTRRAAELRDVSDDPAQFKLTLDSLAIDTELGRTVEARKALDAYSNSRHELLRDTYGGDNVMYLNALAKQLGALPAPEWIALRDKRLESHLDRDDLLDGRSRSWIEYFVIPATTPSEARNAVDALPHYMPILHRTDREILYDASIGATFSLSGDSAQGMPYFERATHSCTRLRDLVAYAHSLLWFGEDRERAGDRARACSLYRELLSLWPTDTGSVSSNAAATRMAALCSPHSSPHLMH